MTKAKLDQILTLFLRFIDYLGLGVNLTHTSQGFFRIFTQEGLVDVNVVGLFWNQLLDIQDLKLVRSVDHVLLGGGLGTGDDAEMNETLKLTAVVGSSNFQYFTTGSLVRRSRPCRAGNSDST